MKENDAIETDYLLIEELDFLFQERKLIKDRIAHARTLLFRFITVVVTPFFLILGYSIFRFESNLKFILLFVPFFSLLAIMVMGILYMHFPLCGIYNRYLAEKINNKLREPILFVENLDYAFFHKGFNIKNVLFLICALLFSIMNISAIFVVNDILPSIHELKIIPQESVKTFTYFYWSILLVTFILCVISLLVQFVFKVNKLSEIINSAKSEAASLP